MSKGILNLEGVFRLTFRTRAEESGACRPLRIICYFSEEVSEAQRLVVMPRVTTQYRDRLRNLNFG